MKDSINKRDNIWWIRFLLRGSKGGLFFLLLSLFSCLEDRDNGHKVSPDEEGNPQVTLSVTIPGIHTSSTRSLSEADESVLESVHIFAFRDNGEGYEETYLYHTHATDITGQGNQWKFNVYLQLSEGDVRQRLVLLANLKEEVELTNPFDSSQTKEEVLSSITFLSDVAWRTTDPVRTLPMWGQSDTTYLITGTTKGSDLSVIPLMRSVARIDVGINLNTSDQPQGLTHNRFELREVYLYNVKDKGAVAPLDSCYDRSGGQDLKGIVTHPTIPASAARMTTPIRYSQENPANVFLREIYLSEADNIASGKDAVSMVIGGYFTPESDLPNSLPEMTYYRIDFYDTSKTIPERFNLLRNHRYRVNILSIRGPGYASKEIAIQEPPINIDTEIEVNEEGVILDVVYDGQHYLGVNQALFELSGDLWEENETTETNLLIVNTSHPDGWRVSGIRDAVDTPITDWLKISKENGPVKTQSPARLLLEENKTGAVRTGYIYLTAGELEHKVTVNQNFLTYLKVTDGGGVEIPDGDTLYYESGVMGAILPETVQLEWSPGDLEVLLEDGSAPFSFDMAGDVLTNGATYSGGYKTLSLQAAVMLASEYAADPFLIKETAVTFRVAGTTLSRRIILKQEKKGITEDACLYPLDGGYYSFTVKSNTLWNVSLTTNTDGIVQTLETTSGGNNKEGEAVRFRMSKVDTPFHGTATLTFRSPLNEFPDEVVTIRGGTGEIVNSSNSYMVKPGAMGIRIPVSRANEYTTLVGEADAINSSDVLIAELLWTDNRHGISCESNVASVAAMGSGHTGYIQVWPGDVEGNAVVAVKVNGTIKWSWHIWVTNYDPAALDATYRYHNGYYPNTFIFMDRNLGAFSNTPGDPKTMGLHYQWARKDPFPGAKDFVTSEDADPVPVYNALGEPVSVPSSVFSVTNDITYNIENPTVFTQGFDHNHRLWEFNKGEEKSIYDPCPEGWHVPNTEGYNSPWYSETLMMVTRPELYEAVWNYGYILDADWYRLGYYPAVGVRTGTRLQLAGTQGRYWTTQSNGVAGWMLLIEDDMYGYDPFDFQPYYYGCAVRCLKEEEPGS